MGRLSLHPDKFKPTPGMVIAVFESVGIDYHLSHKEMLIRCPFHDDSGHKRHCYVNVKDKPGVFHCFAGQCKAHGDFMDLIVGITKWNAYKALTFCRQFTEAEVPELPPPPEPPSEAELVKYKFWHPYCFDRGLTRDTLRRWGIGYDREENAVVIPWRSAVGQLCGLKRRYIITKRYIMTEGFVPTLFGAQFIRPCESVVWLFEAEFDAMLVDQIFREEDTNDCACAIGGSDMSEGQLKQLLTLQPAGIVLFMDNDPAGKEATEKLLEKFLGRTRAIVAQYPAGAKKDAGEMSRSQLQEMITATRGRL